MIRIAIVDDQTEAISGILSVFQQWEKENHAFVNKKLSHLANKKVSQL